MSNLRWDKAPYGRNEYYTDVSGIGRYLLRKDGRRWIVMLNGQRTKYYGDDLEQAKSSVQRVADAILMEKHRQYLEDHH